MSKPLWQVMSGYLQPSEPPKGRKERRISMGIIRELVELL